MEELENVGRTKEFERFSQSLGAETDPVMRVLRAHLYTENLLERLIVIRLPRGDKVIETASLTYHQKLVLVEAIDCLPDHIASSLRQLNKLRNQCAHKLDQRIADGDITRLGSPLGKRFTQMKRDAKFDEGLLLKMTLDYVCGFLGAAAFFAEHPDLKSEKAKPTAQIESAAGKE